MSTTARKPTCDERIAIQLYTNPAVPSAWKAALAERHFGTPAFPGLDVLLAGETADDEALVARVAGDRAALGHLVAYLADHPRLIGATLLDRIADLDPGAARTLAQAMLATGREEMLVRLLDAEATPAAIIAAVVERRPRLAGIAVRHEHCPAAALERAARTRNAAVLERVAGHRSTPPGIVARLARSRDGEVRRAALGNPALPDELLQRAAHGRDPERRAAVARNVACPQPLLERLAADAAPAVRAAVAHHPWLSSGMLRRLARDIDPAVRAAAWASPQLTGDELVALLNAEPCVYARIGDDSALDEASHAADPAIRHAVARNPAASASTLKRLADDADETVRCAASATLGGEAGEPTDDPVDTLLQRDDLPPHAFVILVGWRFPYDGLVVHPAFPASLVSLCFREGDDATRKAIYLRFPFDADRVGRFATEDLADDALFCHQLMCRSDLHPAMLAALARHPSAEIRCEVAAHAATPADVLEGLAADESDEVRAAVILNAGAGDDVRRRLLCDEHFRPARVLLQRRPPVERRWIVDYCIHLFSRHALELAAHRADLVAAPGGAHRVPAAFRNLEPLLRHPYLPAPSIEPLLALLPGVDQRVIRIGNEDVPLGERQALLQALLRRKTVSRDIVEMAGNGWMPTALLALFAQRLGLGV